MRRCLVNICIGMTREFRVILYVSIILVSGSFQTSAKEFPYCIIKYCQKIKIIIQNELESVCRVKTL